MKKFNLPTVIEGAFFLVFGLLVAILGVGTIDLYIGILCLVVGIVCIGLSIMAIVQKGEVSFKLLTVGGAFLAVGIAMFTDFLSFAMVVNLIVIILLGYGAGILVYGIVQVSRKETAFGIIDMVIGAGLVTFNTLYLTLPSFRGDFWLTVGILIAIYGAFLIVLGVVEKKS